MSAPPQGGPWLSSGIAGVIGDNNPGHMVEINELLASCVIFHHAAELTGGEMSRT